VSITIGAGRWDIPLDDAKAAVAGYAFAERRLGDEKAPKWGYRTFDCIPASPGAEFSDLDITVAAGLNAQLDIDAIAALQLATRRAQPYLTAAVEREQRFTELPPAELNDEPPRGSTGWLLAHGIQADGGHSLCGPSTPAVDRDLVGKATWIVGCLDKIDLISGVSVPSAST
jgi:hypothetical protein